MTNKVNYIDIVKLNVFKSKAFPYLQLPRAIN